MSRTFSGRMGLWTHDGSPPPQSGQAEVLRCIGPGEMVAAVKTPRDSSGAWLNEERRSIEEIAARVGDAHEWLIPVIDHGHAEDGRPFMVMPFFPWTLDRWIEAQKPSLAELLAACARACHAVHSLHASSPDRVVLHRDLKPGNFLVRPGHHGVQVVLGDLGLAKSADTAVETRSTGTMTMGYAPVEQALPVRRALTPATDIHALGVTVYAALVGREPQGVLARRFTVAGDALLNLHWVGVARLDDEDRAEYDRLRELPLEALVEFSGAPPLTDSDVRRLHGALAARLGSGLESHAQAVQALVSLLTHAMRAHPDERLADAQRLDHTLRRFAEEVGQVRSQSTFAPGAVEAGDGVGMVGGGIPAFREVVVTGPPVPPSGLVSRPVATAGGSRVPRRTDSPGTFSPGGSERPVVRAWWGVAAVLGAGLALVCGVAGVWFGVNWRGEAPVVGGTIPEVPAPSVSASASPSPSTPSASPSLSASALPASASPSTPSAPSASPSLSASTLPASATPSVTAVLIPPEATVPPTVTPPPVTPAPVVASVPAPTPTMVAVAQDLPAIRVIATFAPSLEGERVGPGKGEAVSDDSPFTVGSDPARIQLRHKDRTGAVDIRLQVVASGDGAALSVTVGDQPPMLVPIVSGSRVALRCSSGGCRAEAT